MARDLRREPPRRWNVSVEGIIWLPRLIDKVRAAQAGTLGTYLYGQSPIDREVLRAAGLGHGAFYELVQQTPGDDAAVLAALDARYPGAADRLRAWSAVAPRRHALFFPVLDADDGYAAGPARLLKAPLNAGSAALAWVLKRVWPYEPAKRKPS